MAFELLFAFLLLTGFSFCERSQVSRICIIQSSCRSCLNVDKCSWCSDWDFSNSTIGKPRCNTKSRHMELGCPEKKILTAIPSSVKFMENADFQDVTGPDQLPIQLRPQKAQVRIRPGTSQRLRVQYRPAKNYPLDLYYLMDFTFSMNPHKEKLVYIGEKMATTLGNLTRNFRLGFGSFADKPLMPYIAPGKENKPCYNCGPIYAFKHHMALTSNVKQFFREVNTSKLTGNLDDPEDGMEALVQAISCTKQVKWAQHARKLILVATNSLSHFAGDGKLAGVVRRQDFHCHLNEEGEYSQSKNFDYPSLEEIYHLLHKKKVNLIFAVSSLDHAQNKIDFHDNSKTYEEIARLLEETTRVGYLQEDSSNILEIIQKAYREIIAKVVLRDDSNSPNIEIDYYSDCGDENAEENKTRLCEGVQEGKIYSFDVEFSAKECPANRSLWKQTVTIDDALASETSKIIVDVELICDCDCQIQENSSNCLHGMNECGLCKCDQGWTGETCNCDLRSYAEKSVHCVKPGDTWICSKKGECSCGHCECDKGYDGTWCECSPCDIIDGLECGGRGICDCGTCKCYEHWEGPKCQCPSSEQPCIAPGTKSVCANHGYCYCGQCRCNVTDSQGLVYRGVYCESSASVGGSEICNKYSVCVSKTLEKSPDADEFCRSKDSSSSFLVELVDYVDRAHENYCYEIFNEGAKVCTIHFIYDYGAPERMVNLRIKKECHEPISAIYLSGMIIFTILIGGVLMLVAWRFYAFIVDRREYAQFEKDRKRTIFRTSLNPLYRGPIQEFQVPEKFKEIST